VYPCQYDEVDLNLLVNSCIRQSSHFAQSHRVALGSSMPDNVFIRADSLGISRVLMNLLHNAIKFNRPGGSVYVTVEPDSDFVRLRVRDTGRGISVSDQQKLFQRYQQGTAGKSYASGTGLGLYLCRKIIEGHQGRITCESQPGGGSTFLVVLPSQPEGALDAQSALFHNLG
jgi:signal transduction histidine kinase